MRIDRRLYLVIPIYKDEEGSDIVAHVHSAPLSEEVVDRYFMVLGKTYNAIFTGGLGMAAGPGHAMRILRHVAEQEGVWKDDQKSGYVGVENGLVAEMRRLTNVSVLRDGRWEDDEEAGARKLVGGTWEALPLDVAVQAGAITEEDRAEVENAVAFFIAASATLSRAQRPAMVRAAAELWGAQVTSSPFTEFSNSLRTSTATASSGERPPAPAAKDDAPANATVGGKQRRVPV